MRHHLEKFVPPSLSKLHTYKQKFFERLKGGLLARTTTPYNQSPIHHSSSVMLPRLVLRARSQLLRTRTTPILRYSSLAFENEDSEFANRSKTIAEKNEWFFPSLAQLRDGQTPTRVPKFRATFEHTEWPESKKLEVIHVLEGRITSVRKSGKGMIFLDITQDFERVQIILMNKMLGQSKDEFAEHHNHFKKGDHVVAVGYPGITNTGELSLKCTQRLKMASPIMHPIPPKLTDGEKRHSNRVVDFLVNKRSKDIMVSRSKIIKVVRSFLDGREFLEVSTPTIASNTKGANATPFTTHSKHIKKDDELIDLQLRVAPELWLKKLVIGGFDKVYEVGKVFRNEGIDSTHNVEFTTCEFYQSFTTLEELMTMTESMFKEICEKMLGFEVTREQSQALLNSFQTTGFRKLEFIPEVELATGTPLPSKLSVETLTEYFVQTKTSLPKIKSVPHLLDKLSSTYLEPQCTSIPTLIYHQPSAMSPLAKSTNISYSNRTYDISRRFELFINGAEYVNAYEEENSPLVQSQKFKLQQQLKDSFHDQESIVPDHKFLQAMEWGLPPTGGWGLGVDRLCMLLVGEKRIEEVLTFGTLPDVTRQ